MAEIVLLLNPDAGGGAHLIDEVSRDLREAGVEAELRTVQPAHLKAAAVEAVRDSARIVIAAGGDGTLSTVAAAVAGSGATLGVLPAGTLNHFCRDLGIPADLRSAARVIARGHVRQVDVGDLNAHTFLNNCSIGLYPRIVRRREGQRQRLGRGKWIAMALAAFSLFRRYPLVRVTLEAADRTIRCTTPLVFVGNNRYETSLLNLGRRTSLDRGELSVYLAKAPGRLDLLRLAVRVLFGRLEQDRDFQMLSVTQVTIETRKRKLRVAMDGEVVRMRPPLVFRVRPGALRVLSP